MVRVRRPSYYQLFTALLSLSIIVSVTARLFGAASTLSQTSATRVARTYSARAFSPTRVDIRAFSPASEAATISVTVHSAIRSSVFSDCLAIKLVRDSSPAIEIVTVSVTAIGEPNSASRVTGPIKINTKVYSSKASAVSQIPAPLRLYSTRH